MADKEIEQEAFGPNIWLVDDMYRRYQENPKSVGESWQDFFEDYRPDRATPRRADPQDSSNGGASKEKKPKDEGKAKSDGGSKGGSAATQTKGSDDQPKEEKKSSDDESSKADEGAGEVEDATPLRGIAARIAENMEASLEVPTATSVRTIPAKLLEENRRIINRYLAGRQGGKISFTHLIGYAVLRALETRPRMKASYDQVDGKPHIIERKRVNLGLAVDVERSGNRVLLVPNIKEADQLDFAEFWSAYEDIIRKVRKNELSLEDFSGTTVTLTNPGTVGTSQSVPRLMPGQGLIVGVGAIGYPTEYEGADPRMMARVGVSKVITITSTYDHRVIQGAESGQFLAAVHDLLLGEDRFYDDLFASLNVPYQPVRWKRDHGPLDDADSTLVKQSRVIQLINMYRVRGHMLAELNPIGWEVLYHPELDLATYELTVWDMDREFLSDGLPGDKKRPLREIIETLRDAYCRTIGYEFMHISDPTEKRWIQERVESSEAYTLTNEERKHILDRLNAAEAFERFVHSKYTGQRRYSIEGADSLIPILDAVLEEATKAGMIEIVMGMSHRGRLNVLANIVGKPLQQIFDEFEGDVDPDTVQGSGDVKYHLGMTGRFASREGKELNVVLSSNASHLESVDPVVEGMARAKQGLIGPEGHFRRDARADPRRCRVPGPGRRGRDLAALAAVRLPNRRNDPRRRQQQHRLHDESEGGPDEPLRNRHREEHPGPHHPRERRRSRGLRSCSRDSRSTTGKSSSRTSSSTWCATDDMGTRRSTTHRSPSRPCTRRSATGARSASCTPSNCVNRGELSVEEAESLLDDFRNKLQKALDETKESLPPEPARARPPKTVGVLPPVETGVERDRLELIHEKLTTWPGDIEPHPKIKKMLEKRRGLLEKDASDWAHGEALAFGSLLLEGFRVRIAGQDTRRGTFSQRHSVLIDYRTEEEYMPLNHLAEDQAPFRSFDSSLSEFAAVGFEYGYSIANGDALVCWEAQFGDFANGAQVIIDQYIVAGEDKWKQPSGLVMLLPHGYEGQGPEHSSARLERFLTLAAEDSIQVVQPTTPAQYFHVLRRQMLRSVRKPLVVMTPKSLLRHAEAKSKTDEFTSGSFRETLDDPWLSSPDEVESILLCTGKLAYTLKDERNKREAKAAVVRVEQIYPFPEQQLGEIFDNYPNAKDLCWVQDEPENMGAWTFIQARLNRMGSDRLTLRHAARAESASPATGSPKVHEQELEDILNRAFEPPSDS